MGELAATGEDVTSSHEEAIAPECQMLCWSQRNNTSRHSETRSFIARPDRPADPECRHDDCCRSLTMARIEPVSADDVACRAAEVFERLHTLFDGAGPIPAPFFVYARVPAFLQDYYANFKRFVWNAGELDAGTRVTLSLAVSSFLRCSAWADFFAARCIALGFSQQHIADTAAVVSACRMYNLVFTFGDLSDGNLPAPSDAGLRAHTFGNTSLESRVVELVNIAISNINGCKTCTAGHVEAARKLGVTDAAVLECIQCAAVVAAGCTFLNAARD